MRLGMSGEEVKRRREALGKSIADLARASGYSAAAISQWEKGAPMRASSQTGIEATLRMLEKGMMLQRAREGGE